MQVYGIPIEHQGSPPPLSWGKRGLDYQGKDSRFADQQLRIGRTERRAGLRRGDIYDLISPLPPLFLSI